MATHTGNVAFADLNADSQPDIVYASQSGYFYTAMDAGVPFPLLLSYLQYSAVATFPHSHSWFGDIAPLFAGHFTNTAQTSVLAEFDLSSVTHP